MHVYNLSTYMYKLYSTGKSGLHDIHTIPKGAQHPRVSAYISGKA